MRDEMDGRFWAEHHGTLSDGIAAIIDTVKISFARLNAIQFDAPWQQDAQPKPGVKA